MLRKQARKARADHAVNRSMMPGNKILKRKPLTELCVDDKFTEDIEECNQELQRHCDEVYMDPEEPKEVQEQKIEYFKKQGDQQFTMNGRGVAIIIDLVSQA